MKCTGIVKLVAAAVVWSCCCYCHGTPSATAAATASSESSALRGREEASLSRSRLLQAKSIDAATIAVTTSFTAASTVTAVVGRIKALRLMDAVTNRPMASYDPMTNGTIDLSTLPSQSLNIGALAEGEGPIGSVVFASLNRRHVENSAPWSFCGNNGADFNTCGVLTAGFNATIAVTPYELKDGRGAAGRSQVVTVQLVKGLLPVPSPVALPTAPKVPSTPSPTMRPITTTTKQPTTPKPTHKPLAPPTRAPIQRNEPVLILINADTDQDVGVINATTALIVGLLETPRVNVRVDNVPTNFTGSVVWSWSTLLRTRRLVPVANDAPYTAAGFIRNASIVPGGIDYLPRTLSWNEGDVNTITAEFWSGKNGTGRYLSSVFGTIQMVGSTTDRTPPEIVSLQALTPTTVDISKEAAAAVVGITYQITVRDNASGFGRGILAFWSDTFAHSMSVFELNSPGVTVVQRNPSSGGATLIIANVTMELFAEEITHLGTQTLKVSLSDMANNYIDYTAQDLLDQGLPATINIQNDTLSDNNDRASPAFLGMRA